MRAPSGGHAPLRVLALLTDGLGVGGGIAAYNRELVDALVSSPGGVSVHILPRRTGAPPGGCTPGVTQERPRARAASYALAALRRGLTTPADWVFCGHLHHAALALAVAALCRARLWIQAHGVEAWNAPGSAIRAAVQRADLVTVVSRHTRQQLLSWASIHPSRVRVLSNTYDPGFTPGAAPAALRRAMAPGGEPVILTVSRLDSRERYKGHEQVMRALVHPALSSTPSPVYVISGEGDDRQRLEDCARRLGVAHRVRFLGEVTRRELVDLYRAADVFAMPSTGEGFGIVFLEAAACGIPVVAGCLDGSRDALRDGLIGRLVDPRDPDAVALAIGAALADVGRPDGFQVFDRDHFCTQLGQVLHTCSRRAGAEQWF